MPLIYEFPPSIAQKCEISHANMGIDGDITPKRHFLPNVLCQNAVFHQIFYKNCTGLKK